MAGSAARPRAYRLPRSVGTTGRLGTAVWGRGQNTALHGAIVLHALCINYKFRMHSVSSRGRFGLSGDKGCMRNAPPIENACRTGSLKQHACATLARRLGVLTRRCENRVICENRATPRAGSPPQGSALGLPARRANNRKPRAPCSAACSTALPSAPPARDPARASPLPPGPAPRSGS